MSFIVTGLGRNGTTSLAKWLGCEHEREGDCLYDYGDLPYLMDRFADGHSEVNSYLRHVFLLVPVDKRLLIIRHPLDILKSVAKWRPDRLTAVHIQMQKSLKFFDAYIELGCPYIYFEEMIEYPEQVCKMLDIPVPSGPLPHENKSKGEGESVDYLAEDFEWFMNKYYG